VVLYHEPPPRTAEAQREIAETSGVVEDGANDAGRYSTIPELLLKIKALREAGLRAEHVTFSFMKRRVQPLMARDTFGYEYTGDEVTSRMPGNEIDNEDIVERLGRIFKDMLSYTPCPVPEYSACRPPNKVSSRLSVWNVVPTLTSNKGRGLSLNGRC
jgi:hypothetical protein